METILQKYVSQIAQACPGRIPPQTGYALINAQERNMAKIILEYVHQLAQVAMEKILLEYAWLIAQMIPGLTPHHLACVLLIAHRIFMARTQHEPAPPAAPMDSEKTRREFASLNAQTTHGLTTHLPLCV